MSSVAPLGRPPARPPATFSHRDFALEALVATKNEEGALVHVVIPARDEEATIGPIVETVRALTVKGGLVDDLLVVDDASRDETAAVAKAAGADVTAGPGLGKGEAMAAALAELPLSPKSLVVFLDGDVSGFAPHFVTGLVGPLLTDPSIDLVKASYKRPLGGSPTGGGRVTELVAKPALRAFFPELASLSQPLSGETALRASLASRVELAGGYAVEVALLIDAYLLGGTSSIAEVDLSERRHRNRELAELVPQAEAVLGAVLARAGVRRGRPW